MLTMEEARQGTATEALAAVAEDEKIAVEKLTALVASGRAVILKSNRSTRRPVGLGAGLRTKVNANLGTSSDASSLEKELEKVDAAVAAGADAVMDLSTGGDLDEIRRAVLERSTVPVGSVPLYQAAVRARTRGLGMVHMTPDDMLGAVEDHARDGMDFVTVHCGVTREVAEHCRRARRLADVVSRGGSFLMEWMSKNDAENPLYERYDDLLDIAAEYDVTLSLGDGLRPGSIVDATDSAQVEELLILGELVEKARDAGVQVIVEGPGHIPLDEVVANVQLQKSVCYDAPFYVLGPLVTDVAAGYDHISGAIGGAVAAMAGADFLCYVTPSEHLALPGPDEVKEGVIASRIAAHAADITRSTNGAWDWDRRMSTARKNLDWEQQVKLCMDPEKARRLHEGHEVSSDACSMCGDLCAMKLASDFLRSTSVECQL